MKVFFSKAISLGLLSVAAFSQPSALVADTIDLSAVLAEPEPKAEKPAPKVEKKDEPVSYSKMIQAKLDEVKAQTKANIQALHKDNSPVIKEIGASKDKAKEEKAKSDEFEEDVLLKYVDYLHALTKTFLQATNPDFDLFDLFLKLTDNYALFVFLEKSAKNAGGTGKSVFEASLAKSIESAHALTKTEAGFMLEAHKIQEVFTQIASELEAKVIAPTIKTVDSSGTLADFLAMGSLINRQIILETTLEKIVQVEKELPKELNLAPASVLSLVFGILHTLKNDMSDEELAKKLREKGEAIEAEYKKYVDELLAEEKPEVETKEATTEV